MEIVIPLPRGLALKINDTHSSGQPYPTAVLQKGLLLLDHGEDLAEEAVGFGVPILKKGLQAIFPGSLVLSWAQNASQWLVVARYTLNLVEKTTRQGKPHVENQLYYAVKNLLAAVIRRSALVRGVLTSTANLMRRVFHLDTTYAEAGIYADIRVTYRIESNTGLIAVEVETGVLPPCITEVVVMNEQGAHHFDEYGDASGLRLEGERIDCWSRVDALEAWFESRARHVRFKLGQSAGAQLYRGRELQGSQLAWSGFGYSYPPSLGTLRYTLQIEQES